MTNLVRKPLILLACLALLAVFGSPSDPIQDLAGHWEGAIDLSGAKLVIDLDFAKQADGTWKGDISIPAQGGEDLPLANINVEGADVVFAIAGVAGDPTFKGKFSTDGAKIAGQFSQGDQTFPFELGRGEDPASQVKRMKYPCLCGLNAMSCRQAK